MSKTKRRAQAARRAAAVSPQPRSRVRDLLYERHLVTHPWCSYGREPHYVPPSFGEPGFYACEGDRPR